MAALNEAKIFSDYLDAHPTEGGILLEKEIRRILKKVAIRAREILLLQFDAGIDGNGNKWPEYHTESFGRGSYKGEWRYQRAKYIKNQKYPRGSARIPSNISSKAKPGGPLLVLSGELRNHIKNNSVLDALETKVKEEGFKRLN